MSSMSREELLRPSLDGSSRIAAAPYSLQTGMWSAFFGGPLAAAAMIGLNAWRIGRLRRDAAWVLLIVVAHLGWAFFLYGTPTGLGLQAKLVGALGGRALTYCERFIALMAFVVGMLLHRAEQRSTDLFGLKRPNGWIVGIGLIVAGWVLGGLLIVGIEA